jgi:mannose/fructose/sorbose-specific phosphotransferase system IIA component
MVDASANREVPVLLVGHADLPTGIRSAVEMILGPQEQLATVQIGAAADLTEKAAEIESALEQMQVDESVGALVLADVLGGSPANSAAAVFVRRPSLRIVAGLSLPMALEVLADRSGQTAEELAEVALAAGRAGVVDVSAAFDAARKSK